MKQLAWMSLILTFLVGIDGIYMVATKYQPKDVNSFHLSDGGTVIVATVILLVVTIIAFVVENRGSKQTASSKIKSN